MNLFLSLRALFFNVFNTLLIILSFSGPTNWYFFWKHLTTSYIYLCYSWSAFPENLIHKDIFLKAFSELPHLNEPSVSLPLVYPSPSPLSSYSLLWLSSYSLHLHCYIITLVYSFVISCLDYCSSVWIGFPAFSLFSF